MTLREFVIAKVGEGNIKDAIEACVKWATDTNSDLLNNFIMLSGRYSRADDAYNVKGIMAREDFDVEMAKVNQSLLRTAPSSPFSDAEPAPPPIPNRASTKNLLFLAANPVDTTPLDLNNEFVKLYSELQNSTYQVKTQWAATTDDLLSSLLDYRPGIIHFSGHGTANNSGANTQNAPVRAVGGVEVQQTKAPISSEGIYFQDEFGKKKFVSGQALANLFTTCKKVFSIDVVVLNACHSALQAQAIVDAGVKYVIGMSSAVPDTTAIKFTQGFYLTLGKGLDPAIAFDFAFNSIELSGIGGENIPKLYKA